MNSNQAMFPIASKEIYLTKLYLPAPGEMLTEELVWRWYCNILVELKNPEFCKDNLEHFHQYYSEAGLLRWWRRPYFRHHFARTFSIAIPFLMGHSRKPPTILDLGCGVGTQSLAMALLGARVVAMDMDTVALDILRIRKKCYEQHALRPLDIQICEADLGFRSFFCTDTILAILEGQRVNILRQLQYLKDLLLQR